MSKKAELTPSSQLTLKQSLITICVFGLFFWFFWKDDNSKVQPEMSRADKEFYMTEASKDGVRARLKDPKSAKFKDVYYMDHVTPVICGKVNSRNGFGGMSGFQHFLARGEVLVLFEKEADDFGDTWNKLCVK